MEWRVTVPSSLDGHTGDGGARSFKFMKRVRVQKSSHSSASHGLAACWCAWGGCQTKKQKYRELEMDFFFFFSLSKIFPTTEKLKWIESRERRQ